MFLISQNAVNKATGDSLGWYTDANGPDKKLIAIQYRLNKTSNCRFLILRFQKSQKLHVSLQHLSALVFISYYHAT